MHLFARAGYDAWGLDISEGELTAAGRIAAANGVACALIRGRVDVLPVRRGVFDVVTAVEVLEHVPIAARPGAVREIAAALRPGGRAIITTPNYGSFVERGKRLAVRFPLLQKLLPYTHYPPAAKRRSAPGGKDYHEPIRREELVAILREAGLDVAPPRAVIFVYKYTPDWLFGVWRAAEDLAERLPGIRGWACTAVVVARRPV